MAIIMAGQMLNMLGESGVHKLRRHGSFTIGSHQLKASVDHDWELTENNETYGVDMS
jgi:hypothetical protein